MLISHSFLFIKIYFILFRASLQGDHFAIFEILNLLDNDPLPYFIIMKNFDDPAILSSDSQLVFSIFLKSKI